MARRVRRLADLFDEAAPGVDTDILGADVTLTTQGAAVPVLRLTCAFASVGGTVVKVVERRSGKTDQVTELNGGSPVAQDARASFDIIGTAGDDYNIQVGTDGAIRRLILEEVLLGGDG